MQITPNQKVGTQTAAMVVVICSTCHQKRWANLCLGKDKRSQARTTCCGTLVTYQKGPSNE